MKKFNIEKSDESIKSALIEKIDNLNKPKGSLGMLEDIALQIGLIQQSLEPKLCHPCHLLMGGDHGIEHEGVSVSPREITWQQMINFTRGGGGVNMFCRQHHFDLSIVDMGVDYDLSDHPRILDRKVGWGTKNFLYEPAMTEEQMNRCIEVGAMLVDDCAEKDCNILSIGEMGIANTSPSSIWMSLFGNIPLDECVGAGAGLDTEGIHHKRLILKRSIEQYRLWKEKNPQIDEVESVIMYFGGFEMVGAIGAMLQAAEKHIVILVDGFIMTACMLAASRMHPEVLDYAIFAHCGDEKAHRRMLDLMNARPLLNLGLRLGEGTGAICAYPIVESAVYMINEMNNFKNANITKYF